MDSQIHTSVEVVHEGFLQDTDEQHIDEDDCDDEEWAEGEQDESFMDITDVHMVRTAKGNDMLCVGNFLYHYEDRGMQTYRWVCNKRKDKFTPCKSRVTTRILDNDESKHIVERVVGEHTHGRCSTGEIYKAFERKRRAEKEGVPVVLENKSLKRQQRRLELFKEEILGKNFHQISQKEEEEEEYVVEKKYKMETNQEDDEEVPSTSWWKGGWNDEVMCQEEAVQEDDIVDSIDKQLQRNRELQTASTVKREIHSDVDEPIFIFEEERVYMLKTAQGRRMMCMDGNLYRIIGKVITNESFRWECIRRDIDCKARVHTRSLLGGEHEILHFPDDNKHTHSPYTPRKLTKLLQKHKIQILGIKAKLVEQIRKPTGSFELINLSSSKDKSASFTAKMQIKEKIPQRSPSDPFKAETYEDPLESLKEKVSMANPLSSSEYTFLPSAKGNRVICIRNFIYHFDSRSLKNGRSYWTCMLRRDKVYKCNARLTTTMSNDGPIIIKMSGTHQHPECKEDIERRIRKAEAEVHPDNFDGSKLFYQNTKKSLSESKAKHLPQSPMIKAGDRNKTVKHEYMHAEDSDSSLDVDEDHLQMETTLPSNLNEMRQNIRSQQQQQEPETTQYDPQTCYLEETEISSFDPNFSEEVNHEEETPTRNSSSNSRHNYLIDSVADMNMSKISLMRSAKGGNLLCIDGYLYYAKGKQSCTTHWSCIKNKDEHLKCKSRVTTTQDEVDGIRVIRVSNQHSHPVSEMDIKRRLYNELVKSSDAELASTLRPKEILNKSLSEISEEYAELLNNSKGRHTIFQKHYTPKTLNHGFGIVRPIMKLYAVSDGPPSLAVRMTFQALKIPFELHSVNYIAAEHLTEEYAKMNPQKEIPVLEDNGFYLSESIAIMQYLCDKYAANSFFYPRDPQKRALVNHRLCFNMGFYYASISAHAMAPIFFDYQRSEMSLKKVQNSLDVFETYLERSNTKYAASDECSIADFALVSSTLCLEAIDFDLTPWPRVKQWYETFKNEYPLLWNIGKEGMDEIADFEKNPPDLSHMNHPFHPTRKPTA